MGCRMDIDEADLEQLFEMIDVKGEGEIDAAEFITPLTRCHMGLFF